MNLIRAESPKKSEEKLKNKASCKDTSGRPPNEATCSHSNPATGRGSVHTIRGPRHREPGGLFVLARRDAIIQLRALKRRSLGSLRHWNADILDRSVL